VRYPDAAAFPLRVVAQVVPWHDARRDEFLVPQALPEDAEQEISVAGHHEMVACDAHFGRFTWFTHAVSGRPSGLSPAILARFLAECLQAVPITAAGNCTGTSS
jgi:hypothetical protein